MQDRAATVDCIGLFKDSLLLTYSNDIIQKDVETGAIQRTFRAHTKLTQAFLVTNDSRLITAGWDDTIIVWDLESGSIIRRIWLRAANTAIYSISFQNNLVYSCGLDYKFRQIDLAAGRVTILFDFNVILNSITVKGDFAYIGMNGLRDQLDKIHIPSATMTLTFSGHTDSVFIVHLSDSILFSGGADSTIISWNVDNGLLLNRFIGHGGFVTALKVIDNELYSGGWDSTVIKWSISDGKMKDQFPRYHEGRILSIGSKEQSLFSSSADTTVMRWNLTSMQPSFVYSGRQVILKAVVLWKTFVISGGDDAEIRFWDTSFNSRDPYHVIMGHLDDVICMRIYEDTLFSGSADLSIKHWNLTDMSAIKTLLGHTRAMLTITSDDLFLYSGGHDNVIKKWNISSGEHEADFVSHSNSVMSILVDTEFLYSGSYDSTVKIWSKGSPDDFQTVRTFYVVYTIFLYDNSIIYSTDNGLYMYSISLETSTVHLRESVVFYSIASTPSRLLTGHLDGLIRSRDFNTLTILETYQGHQDNVRSLCLDINGVLYSASFDGSVRKWNMVTRKVAFSFENRGASVTALLASGNSLLVGTRGGLTHAFEIDTAIAFRSFNLHSSAISSLHGQDNWLFSSGFDGLIIRFLIHGESEPQVMFNNSGLPVTSATLSRSKIYFLRGDSEIMLLPLNNSETTKTISATNPVTCLAVTDSYIVAGSKSGTVISWNIETTLFEFDLKGHTSQVNYLLADRETLYSASDDKTIFSWSLTEKVEIKILQRLSATALGHLGPVNSLSLCKNALFSAGSDNTVRRWNTRSGSHEDVYMGALKPVTSVLCFNGSVFAGSEDFSVLLYNPGFLGENAVTSSTTMKSPNDRVKKRTKSVVRGFSEGSSLSLPSNAIVGGAVAIGFLIIATIGIYSFRKSKDMPVVSKAQMDSSTNTNITTTDLKTVVNSIMGISKHAAFLLESSLIAKSTRIAAGGGGELFLAKIMNSVLAQKAGNVVVQKIMFIASKASEDAFYQEVGIMIMLSSFPHFCQIIGYTENPLSIVMKYYPDGSLFQWLRKNNYGTVLMARALKQIASAVQTMHSHYLAHCDLKTQNILVEANNGIISCYLTDFGITQVLSSYIVASKMLNIINLRGLSVHYASPESFVSFRSKDYSKVDYQKYDIYSLACTMFEIFTKKAPWS